MRNTTFKSRDKYSHQKGSIKAARLARPCPGGERPWIFIRVRLGLRAVNRGINRRANVLLLRDYVLTVLFGEANTLAVWYCSPRAERCEAKEAPSTETHIRLLTIEPLEGVPGLARVIAQAAPIGKRVLAL